MWPFVDDGEGDDEEEAEEGDEKEEPWAWFTDGDEGDGCSTGW